MSQLAPRRRFNGVPDQRSDHNGVSIVYFKYVQPCVAEAEPLIKIGYTANNTKRDAAHRKSKFGVRFDITDLCFVRATRQDEQLVHRYFDSLRLANDDEEENFKIDDQLVDYIRWLRDQYFVYVPDDEKCVPIDQIDRVEPSLWMPTPDRRKSPPKQIGLFGGIEYPPLNLPPRTVTVDDFYTNTIIIEAARQTMGRIDLDPASHAVANSVVKASRYYSLNDNGLAQDWFGNVWLNPPFSEWREWIPKIIGEWQSGRINEMCVLCATRTLTAQYFGPIHQTATAMCVLHGRIPFWGGLASSPDDGHAVFYFGDNIDAFETAFSQLGFIWAGRQKR